MNRLRGLSYMMVWQIQDGGRPPSWISILGHNFGVDQHFCTKFCIEMENRQPKGFYFSEIRFSKIQDGGRPPSWISIFGHNFVVYQHFCTKFCTEMENRQPSGSSSQKSYFQKSKIVDGRHLGFQFWAVISASLNIIAPNLVQWWKIDSSRGPIAQKSGFWKSNTAVTMLNFKKVIIIQSWSEICDC